MQRREFLQNAVALGTGAISWMLVSPLSAQDAAREQVDVTLVGRPYQFPAAAGASFRGLAYNGRVPGPLLRVRYGQMLRARYLNRTGGPSTIHWHGMILPNDMDGVPDITQKPVADGGEFVYTFRPDPPGLRWYHSHAGEQQVLGLFGAFLVEDPGEPRADVEAVLVLHDVPDMKSLRAALAGRSSAPMDQPPGVGGMPGMRGMSGMGGMSGMESGSMQDEVSYLSHCIGGAAYPHTRPLIVKVGQTVRLRIVNASPTLTHYLRLARHQLKVTHSDGNPLPRSITVDALQIGVGERYDVWFQVTRSGAWLLQSLTADARDRRQSVLIRTADAADREPELPPASLQGSVLFDYLLAGGAAPGPLAGPANPQGPRQVRVDFTLGGGKPGDSRWTIDGRTWPHTPKVRVRQGDHVLVRFHNRSDMDHPMHLHGHVFEVVEQSGKRLRFPIRKDTSLVPANSSAAWQFIADAPPGRWVLHCHDQVHMLDGMMTEVDYI